MKKSEASGKSPWILASLLQSNSSIKNIDKETYGGYIGKIMFNMPKVLLDYLVSLIKNSYFKKELR